jgi:hypothetical protein
MEVGGEGKGDDCNDDERHFNVDNAWQRESPTAGAKVGTWILLAPRIRE